MLPAGRAPRERRFRVNATRSRSMRRTVRRHDLIAQCVAHRLHRLRPGTVQLVANAVRVDAQGAQPLQHLTHVALPASDHSCESNGARESGNEPS